MQRCSGVCGCCKCVFEHFNMHGRVRHIAKMKRTKGGKKNRRRPNEINLSAIAIAIFLWQLVGIWMGMEMAMGMGMGTRVAGRGREGEGP